MPSASQAAVRTLEARREVRASRPDSLAPMQPARPAGSNGVASVLVHRTKKTTRRRLCSRRVPHPAPPLGQYVSLANCAVARRAQG